LAKPLTSNQKVIIFVSSIKRNTKNKQDDNDNENTKRTTGRSIYAYHLGRKQESRRFQNTPDVAYLYSVGRWTRRSGYKPETGNTEKGKYLDNRFLTKTNNGGPPVRALTEKVMNAYASVARQIANRHFGVKMVNILSKKGVEIVGIESVPGWDGDKYFCGTAYSVAIGGQLNAIRTANELITMARSSWTASEYLSGE